MDLVEMIEPPLVLVANALGVTSRESMRNEQRDVARDTLCDRTRSLSATWRAWQV
jgi:hypothetical protein